MATLNIQLDTYLKGILIGVIFTEMSNIFPRSNDNADNAKVFVDGKITANRFICKTIIAFGW